MSTTRSLIHVICPGCGVRTLVQHVGPTYVCVACQFDYGELARDRPRFEAFLVERMREGPMGQIGAIALHQWLGGLGAAEGSAAIRALAERNGIALPDRGDSKRIARIVLVAALAVAAVLAAALIYFRL